MQIGDVDDGVSRRMENGAASSANHLRGASGAATCSNGGLGEVEESDSNGVGGGDEAAANGGDESDEEEEELLKLNEETLLQLKRNDPSVTALEAYFRFGHSNYCFDANDIDWENEGNCIGENTHLKSLSVDGLYYSNGDDLR